MKINYIPELTNLPISEVSALLQRREMTPLEVIPWPQVHSFCPQTKVCLAHDRSRLYIQWQVSGEAPVGTKTHDLEQVCEDSCCEFFCRIPGSPLYINLEVNVLGTMTASRRVKRHEDVQRFSAEEFAQIERYTSLGCEPITETQARDYTILIAVPFALLGVKDGQLPSKLLANIYKCGDKTARPHFVSMFPIDIPNPDFHRPDFFQPIEIE